MTSPPGPRPARQRQLSLLARCTPGLGRMLRRELADTEGVEVTGTGSDGAADVVFFSADRAGRQAALQSRLADGVFAELGRATRAGGGARAARTGIPGSASGTTGARPAGLAGVASASWPPGAVQRALSVWAEDVHPLAAAMTFRVTARVLGDSKFSTADLRRVLAAVIGESKPRWRCASDAQLVIYVGEWHDGQYAAGLWLGDGRAAASTPAARASGAGAGTPAKSLAGALVQLAGPPGPRHGHDPRLLLDPCCGRGAILAEAAEAGWAVAGTDTDEAAVRAAAALLPQADIQLGDARDLLIADDSVHACVSWLPSRAVPGGWAGWSAGVVAELARVTRRGGSVVLLAPELPRAGVPSALRLRRQVPVRLTAGPASIWVFRRA